MARFNIRRGPAITRVNQPVGGMSARRLELQPSNQYVASKGK
jgi:hypothetical protein